MNLNFKNGIILRPSSANDTPFIENLFRTTRAFILQANAEQDYLETIVEQQLQFQTQGYGEQYPQAMTFIIEHHRDKIGRVIVDFSLNVAHMVDVMLIPAARNKGYGQSIIQSLQQAATKVMIPVVLTVEQSNILAKQLYLKLGFEVKSVKPPSELMVWYPTRATSPKQ